MRVSCGNGATGCQQFTAAEAVGIASVSLSKLFCFLSIANLSFTGMVGAVGGAIGSTADGADRFLSTGCGAAGVSGQIHDFFTTGAFVPVVYFIKNPLSKRK